MKIRLVAMDLDDTLLRDDFTLSPRVVKAVREAQARGVKMTIATGRTPVSVRPYAEQLGLDLPVITYHGAMIQKVLKGEVLFRRVIPSAVTAEIVREVIRRGIYTQIHLRDRVITSKFSDWSREYRRIASVPIEEADLAQLLRQEPEGVEKILIMDEEETLDQLVSILEEDYGRDVHFTKSKPSFLEVVEKSVNKGAALAALAEGWGIAQSEVMAIGDSYNDIEMLRYAGLGVAMGNARSEIQACADVVTLSNEEDGVARALERYVLS